MDKREKEESMQNKRYQSTLRRCPFCGNKNLTIIDNDEAYTNYSVCCDYLKGGCGSTSGFRETKEEAIELWNKRIGG